MREFMGVTYIEDYLAKQPAGNPVVALMEAEARVVSDGQRLFRSLFPQPMLLLPGGIGFALDGLDARLANGFNPTLVAEHLHDHNLLKPVQGFFRQSSEHILSLKQKVEAKNEGSAVAADIYLSGYSDTVKKDAPLREWLKTASASELREISLAKVGTQFLEFANSAALTLVSCDPDQRFKTALEICKPDAADKFTAADKQKLSDFMDVVVFRLFENTSAVFNSLFHWPTVEVAISQRDAWYRLGQSGDKRLTKLDSPVFLPSVNYLKL